jgi:phosphate transport system substrate-binding protein
VILIGYPIIRVGRQNNSGTYAYFRQVVLGPGREFKLGSIDQSGSKDVVALVSRTPCAIGYSGVAYATTEVKALKVAPQPRGVAVAEVLA